jgi:hypothetical protein
MFKDIIERLNKIGITQNKNDDAYWTEYHRLPRLINNMLEIGVHEGASIAVWNELFQNTMVHGIDCIDNLTPAFKEYRNNCAKIRLFLDKPVPDEPTQEYRDFIDTLPMMDLIIDDGKHTYSTASSAFDMLFDKLNPRGLYIIEDWGTSYWPDWSDGSEDGNKGMKRLLYKFADLIAKPCNIGQSKIAKVEFNHWQIWVYHQ